MRTRMLSLLMPVLLLGGYLSLWRPLRVWSATHVFAPTIEAVAAPGWHVRPRSNPALAGPGVLVDQGTLHYTYEAPGGYAYILPALLLAALAPRRLHWLKLLMVAVGIGALEFACALLGVRNVPGAWEGLRFLSTYVTVTLCGGLAFLWLHQERLAQVSAADPVQKTPASGVQS